MIKKVLALFAAAGSVFAAVFYVLMKQAKEERDIVKAQAKTAEEERDTSRNIQKEITRQEKENEEDLQKLNSDNDLNSFNAGLNLMRKQSEKGRSRNKAGRD